MRLALRDVNALRAYLGLDASVGAAEPGPADDFPVFVPREFADLMTPGDPDDPLLRQVLPLAAEQIDEPGFTADPVGDLAAHATAGALTKYQGRALLVVTGACAVHCRYCFRRHFPYDQRPAGLAAWKPTLAALASDEKLEEVLLSGGDPLTLTDDWLAALEQQLSQIPQVRRLRIHTRLPLMIPSRINPSLLAWIGRSRLRTVVVVHANHPQELGPQVHAALQRLVAAGIPTLNQSVLLRGVNDRASTLIELSQRLIDAGVMPYYLHQLDRVRGAAHFRVPTAEGHQLIAAMRRSLPGYAVPRFVQEDAGATSKTVLA